MIIKMETNIPNPCGQCLNRHLELSNFPTYCGCTCHPTLPDNAIPPYNITTNIPIHESIEYKAGYKTACGDIIRIIEDEIYGKWKITGSAIIEKITEMMK